MGRAVRRRLQDKKRPHIHKPYARPSNGSSASSRPPTTKPAAKPAHKLPDVKQQKNQAPDIPFDPNDRILLVGEGDFSFAASLVSHHGCADVLATCYDAEADLLAKHPQAAEHIATLEAEDQRVLYGVDATKLAQKDIRKGARWDRVMFNFPHVGGKSTDVNRQVRYNQELLVNFFKAASPLLAPEGTIIVTLFEGEPYTLWNVRDLARHVGLRVGRSFKFQAAAYPDYHHARTLGNIAGGGGWKGEDRPARTYVFERGEQDSAKSNTNDAAANHSGPKMHKKTAAGAGGNNDSSDDDD